MLIGRVTKNGLSTSQRHGPFCGNDAGRDGIGGARRVTGADRGKSFRRRKSPWKLYRHENMVIDCVY
jgi:hypothetical protein